MQFEVKAITRACLTAGVFSSVIVAGAQAQTVVKIEVVKIGHVAATSGAVAHLGKDNENGARMAVDELNAQGLVIGGKKVRLALQAEDDAADPKQGAAAAQKLVDAKVSGVVGHQNSGTTIPAAKIYNDAGIPQISPSASNPKYTRQGYNTAFRNIANDEQLGAALAKYALQTGKAKRIAVIDDRTAYGEGLANEFVKNVKRANTGATIVSRQFVSDKAIDFSAVLTAVKASKPDLVFFGGMDAVAGPMLRQMKQIGLPVKFMGGDGMCSNAVPKLAGDAMLDDQVICAEAGGVEPAQEKQLEVFKAAYKKKFGVEVLTYAPYAYDALMTLVAAMQQAGSADPARYLPVLARIRHQGVTGNITFDARGDVKDGVLTLYTFRGGSRHKLAVIK